MRDLLELVDQIEQLRDDGTNDAAPTAKPQMRAGAWAGPITAPRPAELGKRNAQGHRLGEWHQRAKAKDMTVREARRMRAGGKTYVEIGDALGHPWRTIADWCKLETRADA